jgi:hypothetical protein
MKASLAALWMLWLAVPASAQDKVYENKDLPLRLRVPDKKSTVRDKDFEGKWEGTICEFQYDEGWVGGRVLKFDSAMRVEKYADWRERQWKEANKDCRRISEKKLEGKKHGSWLQRELVVETKAGDEFRYVHVFIAKGKVNVDVMIWCQDTVWDEYKDVMLKIAASVEYGELAAPEAPAAKGKKLSNAAGWSIVIPEGWTLREEEFQFGIDNAIFEVGKGDDLAGVLGAHDGEIDMKTYSDAFLKGVRDSSDSFEELGEGKTKGGCLRRDFRGEKDGFKIRYAMAFHGHGKKIYFLGVWTEESLWGQEKADIEAFLNSLSFGASTPGGGGEKEIVVPNPWKGFAPGSSAHYKLVSDFSGTKSEMEMIHVLVEQKEGEYYVMRTDTIVGGTRTEGKPTRVELKMKVKDSGDGGPKIEEGMETIQVAAGEFKCKWTRTTTEQGWTKVWTSADVPFGVVKSEAEIGPGKTRMELVKFEKK